MRLQSILESVHYATGMIKGHYTYIVYLLGWGWLAARQGAAYLRVR